MANCNRRSIHPCRYSLGVPGVGTTEVVYALRTTLCRLLKNGLFLLYVPVTTESTLPPFVLLCNGVRLPIVFSSTADDAQANALIGDRAYLAVVIRTSTGFALNILNAVNPAGA